MQMVPAVGSQVEESKPSFLPSCLVLTLLASEPMFFGLPTYEDKKLSRDPPGLQLQVGTAETSDLCTETPGP